MPTRLLTLSLAALVSTAALACKKDTAKPDPAALGDAAQAAADRPAGTGDAALAAAPADAADEPGDAAPAGDEAAAAPAGDEATAMLASDRSGGARAAGNKAAGARADADTPADRPTNLRVLPKSMSRARVDTIMEGMSRQLGVECAFCHDEKDYASDANHHKGMARKMMVMTRDLNKQFFGGKQEVSCFTCHKGKAEPK